MDDEEFDDSFTGVVLTFEKEPAFKKGGEKPSVFQMLAARLPGSRLALLYLMLATLGLAIPNLVIPVFFKIYVDNLLVGGLASWLTPLLLAMTVTAIVKALLTLPPAGLFDARGVEAGADLFRQVFLARAAIAHGVFRPTLRRGSLLAAATERSGGHPSLRGCGHESGQHSSDRDLCGLAVSVRRRADAHRHHSLRRSISRPCELSSAGAWTKTATCCKSRAA